MQTQGIRSIRLIGVRPTIDLSVNHLDHNFYAEGIVVSNSHALEYACMTAACIYFKLKNPQGFYLWMLKLASEEPDPIGYINKTISEMRASGIQLLPPDLIKSTPDFSIQDGNVRFGLSHIKGVSDVTMQKISSFKRDFKSKFEIFEAAKAAKLDIRTLTGLIYCGCLDSVIFDGSTRAQLALEAQVYNLLTANEKLLIDKFSNEYKSDLLTLVKFIATKTNEKGKPLIRASRMETLKRDHEPYWQMYLSNSQNEELTSYLMERHYLGFSYTSDLYSVFSKKVKGLIPVKDVPITFSDSRFPIKFIAFIGEGKMHISARGVPYWKGELYDDQSSVLCMLHGEEKVESCKRFNGSLPSEGDMVIVSGNLSKDKKIFFCDNIIIQPNPVKIKKTKQKEIEI